MDLLHLSLEKRMAELSPEGAEAGIFKENNHLFKEQQRLQKPAALTGKLEVCFEYLSEIPVPGKHSNLFTPQC